MEVQSACYRQAPASLRQEFSFLQHLAYQSEWDPDEVLHDPALDAHSFFVREGGQIVSYAAVVGKTIRHGGQGIAIAGISCVATHPEYRQRGLANQLVRAATGWLESGACDIGVFSCDPPLLPLYAGAGWHSADDVVLIGGHHPDALRSDALAKVVLLKLLSPKAREMADAFCRTTINLDLPAGQFL